MPTTPALWHPMQAAHLPAVHALAKRVHPGYPERPEIAAERLRLAPKWCCVLIGSDKVAGYLLAHPWRLRAPPRLDTLLGALPPEPDTLYLHDIVINPLRRGLGEGRAGIFALSNNAKNGFPSISLISIGSVTSFWESLGFEVNSGSGLDPILRSYDPDARYMVKFLRADQAVCP